MSKTLFNLEPGQVEKNPMVLKYGRTEGKKCKTCKQLIYHERNRRWYKCIVRGVTCGRGTDHGCTWNACGLYEEG